MPPSTVQGFEEAMLLRGARMVRGPTTRRDIYYRVNICPPTQELVRDFAVPRIQEVIRSVESGGRIIIYCCTKDLAKEVA